MAKMKKEENIVQKELFPAMISGLLDKLMDPLYHKARKLKETINLSNDLNISEFEMMYLLVKTHIAGDLKTEEIFNQDKNKRICNKLREEIIGLLPSSKADGWIDLKNMFQFLIQFHNRLEYLSLRLVHNFLRHTKEHYYKDDFISCKKIIEEYIYDLNDEVSELLGFSVIFPMEIINNRYSKYLERIEMENYYKDKGVA